MSKNKNYYEILEIPTDSTQEELNKSYIRAKNAYSTDSLAFYSLMSKDESERILELIEEAYSVLGDASKRKQYDKARGIKLNLPINQTISGFESNAGSIQSSSVLTNQQTHNKPSADQIFASLSPGEVKRKVAQKKFNLNFSVNNDFEKEIENTQSFSGEFLKKIREYKNVDLHKMSDLTKVSKTYIMHIENECYERLPDPVYVRGFVFQYAKCLKLAPDLVAKTYLERLRENTKT